MPRLLNPANFIFRCSTRLVRYYSNFQNFYVLPYIHFLTLVELERWLAEMHCFPHQHPRQHFRAQDTSGQGYSPDPSSRGQEGLGSRLISETHIVAQRSHRRQLNAKVCSSKSAIFCLLSFLKLAHAHTVSAFTVLCVRVCASPNWMKEREFLSSLATNCRCIVAQTISETTQSERKLLEEEIRNVFSNLLAPRDKIYLQVKDEWRGIFVDFFEDDVVHTNVLRMVTYKEMFFQ